MELINRGKELVDKGINSIPDLPMREVISAAGLALCLVLSSCDGPYQDQKSSPENPGTPNDTTFIVPGGFSYGTRIHEFSKEPPTSQHKR